MKTKNLLIILILISCAAKSQITLEHAYPAQSQIQYLQVVELVKSGYKYQIVDYLNKNVKLYNLNHSIFKSINLQIPTGYNLNAVQVSDSLFNTDNLVEVLYYYYAFNNTVTPATYNTETKIIDENGSTLFTIPQGAGGSPYYTGVGSGYKLIVNVDSTNKSTLKQMNVYSLVGGLPMHSQTQPGGTPTGLVSNNGNIITNATPNPSGNKTTIGYQFPQGETSGIITIYDINGKELKHYQVDSNFSTLELDNSDLVSGTYFYQLGTPTGKSSAKKIVVIK